MCWGRGGGPSGPPRRGLTTFAKATVVRRSFSGGGRPRPTSTQVNAGTRQGLRSDRYPGVFDPRRRHAQRPAMAPAVVGGAAAHRGGRAVRANCGACPDNGRRALRRAGEDVVEPDRREARDSWASRHGRSHPRSLGRPPHLRQEHRRPVLRAGLRAGPGPFVADGAVAALQRRAPGRDRRPASCRARSPPQVDSVSRPLGRHRVHQLPPACAPDLHRVCKRRERVHRGAPRQPARGVQADGHHPGTLDVERCRAAGACTVARQRTLGDQVCADRRAPGTGGSDATEPAGSVHRGPACARARHVHFLGGCAGRLGRHTPRGAVPATTVAAALPRCFRCGRLRSTSERRNTPRGATTGS